MTVKRLSNFRIQYQDSNGALASGYRLFFYASGSSTKQNTYNSSTGSNANTNPITLNALGEPGVEIWLTSGLTYKVGFAIPGTDDPPASFLWTEDVIGGINDAITSSSEWVDSGLTPTYVSGTQFTLAGDQTSTFQVGRRIKATVTAGTVYGRISISAFSALTTITLVMDSGSLDSGLSAVAYGLLAATNTSIPYQGLPFNLKANGGAVGDGVVDDYAAIMASYSTVAAGATIYVPSGTYKCLTAPVFGTKRVHWVGEGSRQSIFSYAGANTSNDCFTWGDGVSEVNGISISGIGFTSATTMAGGAGVRFKLLTRSSLRDVLFDHQDGNGKFYHGLWFDGCDFVTVDGYQCRAAQDGLRVNGAAGSATVGARADLFLSNGKIGLCNVGLRVGGAFGGLYVDSTDIIGNLTNLLVDKTLNAFGNNRECFFGPGCFFDSAGTVASPFSGINVDIQDTGGFVFFEGSWCASAGTLIRTGSSFVGVLKFVGGFLYNGFTSGGGNGNAIEVGSASTPVQVVGTRFKTINGSAFTCTAGGANTTSNVIDPVFESDVTTKFTNFQPLPIVAHGRLVAGGNANFAADVDGNPSQTFYQGTTLGGAFAIGYFGANASNGWIEFAKSRNATAGSQTIISSGDNLGGINFSASDGSVFASAARILVQNVGTPAAGDIAANMLFYSRAAAGALTQRALLLSTGHWVPATTNTYDLGDTTTTKSWRNIYSQNAVTVTSDARAKTDITESELGLSFINMLRPVSYRFIVGSYKVVGAEDDGVAIVEAVPGVRIHYGLLSQEVKAAVDASGVSDFGGWGLMDKEDPESPQTLRYDELIAPLIKAVQELTARVQSLESRLP